MEELADSLKLLVCKILEKNAPQEVELFQRGADQIIRQAMETTELAEEDTDNPGSEEPRPKRSRTRGVPFMFGMEGISVGVTMTSILVHLWHERNLILLTREQQTARERLKTVWEQLLRKRGIDPGEAHEIASEFGDDLHEILESGEEDKSGQ